ncbi:hypothetical protein [Roseateles microcysteis]|uniref:hypothetical protein n=1 Tax=Roseateles microcysteis TaxID=3119057 RepID=UPI002FE5EB6D
MARIPPVYLAAGGAVVLALAWVAYKGGFKGAGAAIGGAAVDLVDGTVSGGAIAIGKAVGIPETNLTECEKAKAEGRTWDASFACPAKDFLSYLWS